MFFGAIIVAFAISANTLALADDCPQDRPLQIEGHSVKDELDQFKRNVVLVDEKCGTKEQGRKRDYSNVIEKLNTYAGPLREYVGAVVELLKVDRPEEALRKSVEASIMMRKMKPIAQRKGANEYQKQIEASQTILRFFDTEAYRIAGEVASADEQLGVTIKRNNLTEAISGEELARSRALIELGRIALFTRDVNLLLGLRRDNRNLEQVRSAYAKHEGSTKPLEEIVAADELDVEEVPNRFDLCEFSQKLSIVKADADVTHLWDSALNELKEVDQEFAQLVSDEIVEPHKQGDISKAWLAGKEILDSLDKKDGFAKLKKLYDVRNLWSKKNRDDQKLERAEISSMRTYVLYFWAILYLEKNEMNEAERVISEIKGDRIGDTGISVDKLLQLQGRIAYELAVKFNKEVHSML